MLLLAACGSDSIDASSVVVDGEPLDQVLERIDTQARAAGVAAAEAQGQEGRDPGTARIHGLHGRHSLAKMVSGG